MTKKDRLKLETAMRDYLQLKALTVAQEKQLVALKEVATEVAARYADEWVDGVLAVPEVGVLKAVLNPPRVVFAATGKPLNDIETVGLLGELPAGFAVQRVNVTRLRDVVARGDRAVLAVLAGHGVVCEQGTRIDIKTI